MGAGNSTPQTARIENPKRGIPIEVTPSVVMRLENSKKQQENVPPETPNEHPESKGVRSIPNIWSEGPQEDMYRRKYNEHEEYQFDKTFEKLENILGKPIAWREDIEGEILGLRKDLIKCYSDNPGQTLHCSQIARKYQDFIFDQQYKSILKVTNGNEEESVTMSGEPQSTPPPPYQHSPPYV
ncbi:uncharacterized protein LOC133322247 [Musca vetustissima]|uniref:uncharacterized protein LOC133322247 n=1 Tax=Musca vetustissima TaxID=27455 RepID=UPI002AB78592|nr:uncharacterized protein LOC133322247 [Musca vetustissima]